MRFIIGFPIVLSVVGFVLAMLALFAGNRPGFMEEYHIIMLNTSMLGHDLVPTPSSGNSPTTTSGGSGVGGFVSGLVASATAAIGAAESKLASIEGDIADKLASEIGIKQFYSLHAMDTCEGYFTPNATAPGAGYNTTNCSTPLETGQYNISAKLDHELSLGPIHLNLADLKWSQDLQNELDKVPKIMMALAVFFMLGAGFSGLSMLLSAAGVVTYSRHPRTTSLANTIVAWLASLTLLVADVITTAGGKMAVDAINDFGHDIGLVAVFGTQFIAIGWSAFALMTLAAIYWTREIFAVRRARRRGLRHNKHMERFSEESYHR